MQLIRRPQFAVFFNYIKHFLFKPELSYSFRIRFTRSPTDTIQTSKVELQVPCPNKTVTLKLKSITSKNSIKDVEQLVFSGDGYSSNQEAIEAGKQYQRALMVAFTRARIGIDFGQRVAKGSYTKQGLELLEKQLGHRILNNVHGLMAYPTNPKPRFAEFKAKLVRGIDADLFQTLLLEAITKCPNFSVREELAFSLFNASFFQPSTDSRFILLVMAIEALIEPLDRSADARAHVEQIIAQTQTAELSSAEKESLLGSLQWLIKESINQAGKRLVTERLGSYKYNELPASKFFTLIYQLRSRLVHGSVPYPTYEEIGSICATLEIFVSDLLTTSTLGYPSKGLLS